MQLREISSDYFVILKTRSNELLVEVLLHFCVITHGKNGGQILFEKGLVVLKGILFDQDLAKEHFQHGVGRRQLELLKIGSYRFLYAFLTRGASKS